MIKADGPSVEMSGSVPRKLTDLTMILVAFRNTDWFTEEMLQDCIENSKLNEEQMTEKLQDLLIQKMLENIQGLNGKEE